MAKSPGKKSPTQSDLDEGDIVDIYDVEISDSDFGLIFDSDGNLKSFFLPDGNIVVPETVRIILQTFGIDPENPDSSQTLQ